MKKTKKTKRTFHLPEETDLCLRLFAAQTRISVSEIISEAIKKFLLESGTEPSTKL
jgi:hypothetical protein